MNRPNTRKTRPAAARKAATLALLLGLAALSGCQVAGGSRQAPVLGGAFTMGLPEGYCIDRNASREAEDSAVLIMGRCNTAARAEPAVVAATLGRPGSAGVMTAGPAALAAFFATPEGRATLSRRGRAEDVRLITAVNSGQALMLHLADRGQGEYWRAFVGVRGRLVSISASGAPDVALPPATGRTILDDFVAAVVAANAA